MSELAAATDLHAELLEVFGYPEFRPHQEEAVRAALENRDCLVVMPTGAGKSLTFQLPAAISEGTTLVISPLIALMRDQIIGLHERTSFIELGAASLNSTQSLDEQRVILDLVRAGKIKLLYIAPERLRSAAFIEALKSAKIARLVVDEAHCISEWGHDFRPDYLAIKDFARELNAPSVFAVTATATKRVQDSICANLGMKNPEIIVGGFNRPNIHFSVVRCKNELERHNRLFKALPKLLSRGGSGLIYASTRKSCEEVGELAIQALAPLGMSAGCYHAGMDASTRNGMQSAWLNGQIPVLVATNAFGMGIDKPDVRFVIHWGFPESPEAYYQEAGRAGRDGKKSRAVILSFGTTDRRVREFFIENEALDVVDLDEALKKLARTAGDETARIPNYWWDQEFGWRQPKPRVVLGKLERAGLLERLGDTSDGVTLRVNEKSIPKTQFRTLERELEQEKNERLARLDEMLGYVKCKNCRRRVMLDYFGDDEDFDNSWCCDLCDARANGGDLLEVVAPKIAQGKVDSPDKISDVYELLQGLDALWPPVGKNKLVKIIRGSGASDVQKYASNAVFGALPRLSVGQIADFLDLLVARGLLNQADEDDYFVVRVTQSGRETWKSRAPLDFDLPGRTRLAPAAKNAPPRRQFEDDDDTFGEENGDLFEKLRIWRRERAIAEGMPPYVIFSDKVLKEIARQMPQDENELLAINGVGVKKAEKYGASVLKFLAN